jgi:D-citramalate synthase
LVRLISKKSSRVRLKLNAEDLKLVTQRIIELEIKKKPLLGKIYLISDVLIVYEEKNNSRVLRSLSCQGLRPSTTLCLKIDGEVIESMHKEMDNLMLL